MTTLAETREYTVISVKGDGLNANEARKNREPVFSCTQARDADEAEKNVEHDGWAIVAVLEGHQVDSR